MLLYAYWSKENDFKKSHGDEKTTHAKQEAW